MSDTSPASGDQVPDSISTEALRAALGKGFPEATALQPVRFGDSDRHEGAHDLAILLALLFSQKSDAPSVIQAIYALDYLGELLEAQTRAADARQRQVMEQVIKDECEKDPLRAALAQLMLRRIGQDMANAFDQLARIRAAAGELRSDAARSQFTIESTNARGADTPHPKPRERYVSDQLLDSLGVDREAFEAYFARRSAG